MLEYGRKLQKLSNEDDLVPGLGLPSVHGGEWEGDAKRRDVKEAYRIFTEESVEREVGPCFFRVASSRGRAERKGREGAQLRLGGGVVAAGRRGNGRGRSTLHSHHATAPTPTLPHRAPSPPSSTPT